MFVMCSAKDIVVLYVTPSIFVLCVWDRDVIEGKVWNVVVFVGVTGE
jgi:hypothetical protein